MLITPEIKQEIIKKFAHNEKDTGSAEVQIGLLTYRINNLTAHCQINKKDFHSRRGLLQMVGKRRRLLNYLNKTNHKQYLSVIAALGLRK